MERKPLAPLPDPEWLFTNLALYDCFPLRDNDGQSLEKFLSSSHQHDWYCPTCGQFSTFKHMGKSKGSIKAVQPIFPIQIDRLFSFEFRCSRANSHIISFIFAVEDGKLVKTAQYPSAADLAEGDVLKYRKLLGKDAKEFSKALGLFAHGVGIGSFVYLRRIIEHLVEATHLSVKDDVGWDEDKYKAGRFTDKVALLSSSLPEFLTNNTVMYGILSKGIHELTEDDCKEAFPVLKTSIELILDEKLAVQVRAEKIKQTSLSLSEIQKKHKGNDKKTTV